jgi:hypothetical protein
MWLRRGKDVYLGAWRQHEIWPVPARGRKDRDYLERRGVIKSKAEKKSACGCRKRGERVTYS